MFSAYDWEDTWNASNDDDLKSFVHAHSFKDGSFPLAVNDGLLDQPSFMDNWPSCDEMASALSGGVGFPEPELLDHPPFDDLTTIGASDVSRCEESTTAAPPKRPRELFSYTKVARVEVLQELFMNEIARPVHTVHTTWPAFIPPEQYFFATTELRGIDFGGVKAGTQYQGSNNFGLLVNYSGDKNGKLAERYPDQRFTKILKLRLFATELPNDVATEDWEHAAIRCSGNNQASVFLYKKVALYVFGGELYSEGPTGQLLVNDHSGSPLAKEFISLGPSNRDSRRNPTTGPSAKRRRKA